MHLSLNWRKYLEVPISKPGNYREEKRLKRIETVCKRRLHKMQRQDKIKVPLDGSLPIDREKGLTHAVSLDCEMVGVQDGKESILARVSVVNSYGHCLFDSFVKPTENVVDYRTSVSGVRPKDMEKGVDFRVAQKAVAELLKGRILVGHDLQNDLKVLYLGHPRKRIRDTSRYPPFRSITKGNTPSLKRLANDILGVKIQQGEHSSVEDAKAAMQLYNLYKEEWERSKNVR